MIARLLLLLLLLLSAASVAPRAALAVDVSELSDFENDPCVQALAQRNADQHVDAPDSELSDNCDRAHGNVEVAWDFLLRTWQPRTPLPVYAAPLPLDPRDAGLAVLQVLLVYAALGTAPRPLLRIVFDRTSGWRRAGAPLMLTCGLRFALAALLGRLLLVGGMHLLAGLFLLAAITAAVRRKPVRRATDLNASRPVTRLLAVLANDAASALAGVLALTLILRGFWAWLGPALLLSLILALPAVHRARVALRRQRWANAAVCALLAGAAGWAGGADPLLMGAAGRNATTVRLLLAAVFAAVVLWRAGVIRARLRPGALPLGPAKG